MPTTLSIVIYCNILQYRYIYYQYCSSEYQYTIHGKNFAVACLYTLILPIDKAIDQRVALNIICGKRYMVE